MQNNCQYILKCNLSLWLQSYILQQPFLQSSVSHDLFYFINLMYLIILMNKSVNLFQNLTDPKLLNICMYYNVCIYCNIDFNNNI